MILKSREQLQIEHYRWMAWHVEQAGRYKMKELTKEEQDRVIRGVSEMYADKGLLIEAGWEALRILSISPDASARQVREMRMAYFAGAQHLWSSIMGVLEGGQEATEKDLQRFEFIEKELREFYDEMKREAKDEK